MTMAPGNSNFKSQISNLRFEISYFRLANRIKIRRPRIVALSIGIDDQFKQFDARRIVAEDGAKPAPSRFGLLGGKQFQHLPLLGKAKEISRLDPPMDIVLDQDR